MYQFTKKKVKGDRLILTNTALCLGHQHLIKKKKNYTDLHQPVLLHSQDGRVVGGACLVPPFLKVRPILESVSGRGQLSHALQITLNSLSEQIQITFHSKDARTPELSQDLWDRDFSVFLPQLIMFASFGNIRKKASSGFPTHNRGRSYLTVVRFGEKPLYMHGLSPSWRGSSLALGKCSVQESLLPTPRQKLHCGGRPAISYYMSKLKLEQGRASSIWPWFQATNLLPNFSSNI